MQKKILMAFDWYDVGLHAGVAAYARERNWNLNTHMARTRQFPLGWDGDGVVGLISEAETLEFVRSLGVPVVDMGGHFSDFPQVLADHFRVGAMAAEHFVERNFRNFVFFQVQNSRLEREIFRGFEATLEAAGHACTTRRWNPTANEQQIRYSEVTRWLAESLAELPRPLAVFCQNDDTAAVIMNTIIDEGNTIPDEIALLGAGNSELICNYLPVRLSSIGSNLRGHGYAAAEQLGRLLDGESPPVVPVRIEPGSVHLRESTDFLAVENPHVARVLREIWDRYDEQLTVDYLQSLVPVSRSGLYDAFIDEVGRPMGKELARVRIRKAKEMLGNTDRSVGEIARLCGFNSPINFSRAFSQQVKVSPLRYRQSVQERSAA